MKHWFWKTYKITEREEKGSLCKVWFARGFVWDVIELAEKRAGERKDGKWAVWDIERIK